MPDYTQLPSHIRSGVQEYIENGHIPGDFLCAVICNNLKESFARADEINQERMFDIVSFFYNEVPLESWGSAQRMADWSQHHGMAGLEDVPRIYQDPELQRGLEEAVVHERERLDGPEEEVWDGGHGHSVECTPNCRLQEGDTDDSHD